MVAQPATWSRWADAWIALFGLSSGAWEAQHGNLAQLIWSRLRAWLMGESVSIRMIAAFAEWLRTEATSSFRLEGVPMLQSLIIGRKGRWDQHDGEQAEKQVAELLMVLWGPERQSLQADSSAFSAFRHLLTWLQDRGNVMGRALGDKVAGQ
jgi:hypothetical protein